MSVTSTAHPVFSDYSHLPKLDDLTFAVGLRSESEEEVLQRMLPLSFITPGKPIERVIRQKADEGICQRVECVARREKLDELNSENEGLREQMKDLSEKVVASKDRLQLLDKSISVQEEKNDALRADIDESTGRLMQLDIDVDRGEAQNKVLKAKLEALMAEIDGLKSQAKEQTNLIQTLQPGSSELVFSRTKSDNKNPSATEVTRLPDYDDDSDDD
jgi:chromosome segregation ATPase